MLLECEIDGLKVFIEAFEYNKADGAIITSVGFKDRLEKKIDTITSNSFEKLMSILPFLSNTLHKNVDGLDPKPSEVSLSVNLGFTVDGQIFIAKGSINSNFNVQISWKGN